MPGNNNPASNVTDMQTGRRSKPWIVSRTHGRYRASLIQTMSITDEQGVTMYDEFDNVDPVFSVREYNGAKASVEFLQSNNKNVESMFMDVDPNAAGPMTWEGDQLAPVDFMINDTGKNSGNVYAGKLLIYGQIESSADSEDTKGAEKNTVGLSFLKAIKVRGGGQLVYNRFVQSPAYVTTDDIAFSTGVGTFSATAAAIPTTPNNTTGPTGASTKYVLYTKKNGNPCFDTSQYAATSTTFTPTVAPQNGDVWEVYFVQATTVYPN